MSHPAATPSASPLHPEDSIIWTRELTKLFGNEAAVDRLTFAVPHGIIFGFVGPSGSGKTTTIRLLTGVHKPTSGDAFVLGIRPSRFSPRTRARIGYMPQQFVLYQDLTVWENLNFAASIYGMGLRRRRRMLNTLEFVELAEHRRKTVRNISGGMQRRLMLAATLIHNPELLFLDEPTAGVDPVLRRKFWDHFAELKGQGRTLFVTTQYVSETAYCDQVAVLSAGHLLVVDTPVGLRRRAYGGDMIDLRSNVRLDSTMPELARLDFVRQIHRLDDYNLRLVVDEVSTAIPALIDWFRQKGIDVESIQEYMPPFDDVFFELLKGEPNHE